jgi:hypothetical protein
VGLLRVVAANADYFAAVGFYGRHIAGEVGATEAAGGGGMGSAQLPLL